MQRGFEQMKAIMSMDALMAYPNHNYMFHIYTDASDYQLGAVIIQNGKPIVYYSQKLSSAQQNYCTAEKELLSVVEALKEYHTMLLGAKIVVHMDHKNNTYDKLNNQRVLRWHLYMEDYRPEFLYIEGPKNTVADTLSRLDRGETPVIVGKNAPSTENIPTTMDKILPNANAKGISTDYS